MEMEESHGKVSAEVVNETFGMKLAEIRRSRRLSQAELGRMVNLSRGSISNLESGIQNVQLHQVFTFALVLDAPISELIPLLKDVVVHEGTSANLDELFLELARRQLVDVSVEGEDDANS